MKNKVFLYDENECVELLRNYLYLSLKHRSGDNYHAPDASMRFEQIEYYLRTTENNSVCFISDCRERHIPYVLILAEKFPKVRMIVEYTGCLSELPLHISSKIETLFDTVEITDETDINVVELQLIKDIMKGGLRDYGKKS